MRKYCCQTIKSLLAPFITLLFLAACAAPPDLQATESRPDILSPTATLESSPFTPSSPTATLPPATPTTSPTPTITVYNLYVGKDLIRQPEPIYTPLTELIPIKDALGYAGSYMDLALDGKMVGGEDILGDPEMLAMLIQLYDAIRQAGFVSHTVYSSYRSFEDQKALYEKYGSEYPDVDTTLFSAEPGRSEHQLGTVFDLGWSGDLFGFYYFYNVPAAGRLNDWMHENAHRYGFVLSYPFKSSADGLQTNVIEAWVTEYKAEPWHWRYVGVELAAQIFDAQDEAGSNYLSPYSTLVPQQFFLP